MAKKKDKNGKSKKWTCRMWSDGVRHPAVEMPWDGDCRVCGQSRPVGGRKHGGAVAAEDSASAAPAVADAASSSNAAAAAVSVGGSDAPLDRTAQYSAVVLPLSPEQAPSHEFGDGVVGEGGVVLPRKVAPPPLELRFPSDTASEAAISAQTTLPSTDTSPVASDSEKKDGVVAGAVAIYVAAPRPPRKRRLPGKPRRAATETDAARIAVVPPEEISPDEGETSQAKEVEKPFIPAPDAREETANPPLAPATVEPPAAPVVKEVDAAPLRADGAEALVEQARQHAETATRAEASANAAAERAEASCQGAESAVKIALEHVGTAEAHMRRAVASATRSAERAGAAEEACRKAETAVEDAVQAAAIAKDAAEAADVASKAAAADAQRTDQLQRLAHASTEAADTSAQKAEVEAGMAEDARKAADRVVAAFARRKWTAWVWPVAFVFGCATVVAIALHRIPVMSDVKSVVQFEFDERGATARQFAEAQTVAPASETPASPALPVQQTVESLAPPAPAPATPAPADEQVVASSTPAPPTAQAVASALPSAPVAQPPVVVASPQAQSTPAAPPVSAPAQVQAPAAQAVAVVRSADECVACVSKMRAPPLKFAEQDARAGCAFLCGGR